MAEPDTVLVGREPPAGLDVPMTLRKAEPWLVIGLAVHGLAVDLVDSTSTMEYLVVSVSLLGVLGVAGLLGWRSRVAVVVRCGTAIVLGYVLMLAGGPSGGYILLWYFVLAAVYPLVLPSVEGWVLVAVIPVAYLALLPFGAADGPVAIALVRAGSLVFVASFVHTGAAAFRRAVAQRDGAFDLLDTYSHGSPVGMALWDRDLRVRRMNQALASLLGLQTGDQLGRRPHEIPGMPPVVADHLRSVLATGTPERDVEILGGGRTFVTSWYPVRSGREVVAVGSVVVDVSAEREATRALTQAATHDPLTRLPNRALLSERLADALGKADRSGQSVAVLLCDVDRFKVVNDSLGHDAGDELLRATASRLSAVVGPDDTVARLGGDEFAIVAAGLGPAAARSLGERICAESRRPLRVGADWVTSTMSVGVTVAADGETDPVGVLRDADAAMYRAKESGRDQVAMFDVGLRPATNERLEFRASLRRAVEADQIRVVYQPVYRLDRLRSGSARAGRGRRGGSNGATASAAEASEIVGFEALARWTGPEGEVSPAVFIPTAEDAGFIAALGEQVLRHACSALVGWRRATGRPLTVAVNLSARQLADPRSVARIGAILADVGVPASAVHLEITESILMADVEGSIRRLRELRALGVSLAVDDFGTGYSSLAYLRDLPVDMLKIDRSFVSRLPEDSAVIGFVVDLARAIGAKTVVEGVETAEQLRGVARAGCDIAQGYYLSRPLGAAEISSLLATGGRARS
ncbi:putative bifunctional diguanylate cyclase/phosphodiesterase [Actinotalea sp.]|uniref:putative bifunctional diguanylate cyclase/phosphodiesterase n=1 Tax=Actinotalea sp. TaxID=1872145 RepID=UPI003562EF78